MIIPTILVSGPLSRPEVHLLHSLFSLPPPHRVEGGYIFTSVCLFVTCKIEDFLKNIGQSILLFCLFVCVFVCQSPTGYNFKPIFTKLHHMVEFEISKKPIVLRSKVQHRPKVNNFGAISKILNFHPIDLKFEQGFHISSLNTTTN